MRTGFIVALVGGLLLAPASPSYAQASRSSAPTPQPSVELPADLDRVLRDYEAGWSGGDAARLAALFVEEGLIVRDGTWIRGRAAIERAYATAGGALRLRAVEYASDGDVGYIVGAYGYGDELPVVDRGLFVLTLARDADGPWLIVSDMDRSGGL